MDIRDLRRLTQLRRHVMPAIAASACRDDASFYWHLSNLQNHLGVPTAAADQTYNQWVIRGVGIIDLDNTAGDAFDVDHLAWFDALQDADLANLAIRSIVVGMHEPLPHSLPEDHSMCASSEGIRSDEYVYARLARARHRRPVYVLASHEHHYLAEVYATAYWRHPAHHASIVPGWVIGTDGAARHPLPTGVTPGLDTRERAYGYLLRRVDGDGHIAFEFRELDEAALQRVRQRFHRRHGEILRGRQSALELMAKPAREISCELSWR